jgi:hypothetical protein
LSIARPPRGDPLAACFEHVANAIQRERRRASGSALTAGPTWLPAKRQQRERTGDESPSGEHRKMPPAHRAASRDRIEQALGVVGERSQREE